MNASVKIEGMDAIVRKMRKVASSSVVDDTLKAYAEYIRDDVRPYPPESEANRPPVPYYIRGQGTQTASRNLGNSQDMRRQWRLKSSSKLIALTNEATYSGYVQGLRQPVYHVQRGWKSANKRAKELLGQMQPIFNRLFERQWRKS